MSPRSMPAFFHTRPSLTTAWIILFFEGVAPSKTIELRCFHICHSPRMMIAFASLPAFPLPLLSWHHAPRLSFTVGIHSGLRRGWQIAVHTSRATTHWSKMWFMLSSSWLHIGQQSWWSSPRLASRSDVQHLVFQLDNLFSLFPPFSLLAFFFFLICSLFLYLPSSFFLFALFFFTCPLLSLLFSFPFHFLFFSIFIFIMIFLFILHIYFWTMFLNEELYTVPEFQTSSIVMIYKH